jgi:hypothetical protein
MAQKMPRKSHKPSTLDAISRIDAIEILRVLADRDKKLSQEIDVIAKKAFWATSRWTTWENR